ncbi:hypothetical protein [Bacillus cereus]|uniref:hypothetical protein n=1 Tax=Bacillus cereus TaxID=1396 RepID=UPI0018CD5562|nr:hypothetical protein [Bacillus cereus]
MAADKFQIAPRAQIIIQNIFIIKSVAAEIMFMENTVKKIAFIAVCGRIPQKGIADFRNGGTMRKGKGFQESLKCSIFRTE